MITIENLHKQYGKLEVLQGVDLRFEKAGTINAVLGPNGSGKTTLIKSILGMVLPSDGRICFDDRPVAGEWAYRSRIGYLPQIARFPENLRVSEVLAMIQDIRGRSQRVDELIDRFELTAHLEKRFSSLSGGTKQKVNLTLAFLYDSPVFILDEPTSGLDPVALLRFKELVRAERAKGKRAAFAAAPARRTRGAARRRLQPAGTSASFAILRTVRQFRVVTEEPTTRSSRAVDSLERPLPPG